jgi:hypothetical protein
MAIIFLEIESAFFGFRSFAPGQMCSGLVTVAEERPQVAV